MDRRFSRTAFDRVSSVDTTPLVACLFASPLAWQDSHGKLHGIEGLDGDAEREAIAKALEERRSNEDQRERVIVDFQSSYDRGLAGGIDVGSSGITLLGPRPPAVPDLRGRARGPAARAAATTGGSGEA